MKTSTFHVCLVSSDFTNTIKKIISFFFFLLKFPFPVHPCYFARQTKKNFNQTTVYIESSFFIISEGPFNVAASKGKQMLPGGSKSKSAMQAGYFDKNFQRIMTGEGYSDPVKVKRQERLEKAKLNLGQAFTPSHSGKMPYVTYLYLFIQEAGFIKANYNTENM